MRGEECEKGNSNKTKEERTEKNRQDFFKNTRERDGEDKERKEQRQVGKEEG